MNKADAIEAATVKRPHRAYYCDFCSRSDREVSVMVSGPDVAICGDCVMVCHEIVTGHRSPGDIEYESWALPDSKPPNVEIEPHLPATE